MSKKVSGAIAVLVVLLSLLMWQTSVEDTADHQAPALSVELPEIEKDKIDGLTITTPENGEVALAKVDGKWRVQKPLDFPAAETAVDTALDKLSGLETVGVAATKADNHARLEVDDEQAIKVTVSGGGSQLADLRIGVYRSGNTMVRKADEDLVASVNGSIRFAFDKPLKDWRDREIHKAEVANVESVRFESEKGVVTLVKDGETFKQAEGEAPIDKYDPVKAKSIIGSACSLRAVDFVDAPDLAAIGLGETPKAKVTVELGGETPGEVTLLLGDKKDNQYYAKRADTDTVYLVSNFMGERLASGPEDFVKEDKPEGEAPPAAAAPMPGGGNQQIPPEVMQQIQQQLQAQGIKPQ